MPISMTFEFVIQQVQLSEGEFWRCYHVIRAGNVVVGDGHRFTSRYKWWAIAYSMIDVAQHYILTRKG